MKTFAVSYAMMEDDQEEPNKIVAWSKNINWPKWILGLLIIVFLISVYARVRAPNTGLVWLTDLNGAKGDPLPSDIGVALGPLLALALTIERLIETIFDMFETNIKQIAKYTAAGHDGLKYIQEVTTLYTGEMTKAKDALKVAIGDSTTNPEKKNQLIKSLEDAEQRLKDTGALWENLPKDPKYVSWKRALSIGLGLTLGMVVAVFSEHGLFYYLNLSVPRLLDMLVTGFVLGAGSGPMHSLIGILQSAKDSLANVGSFAGFSSVEKELRSLRAEVEKK